MNLPWVYEPCDPEDAADIHGIPWGHAVRGARPGGRRVMGYGHTEPQAQYDATRKATEFDARETIGQRGEIVTAKLGGNKGWKIAVVKVVE